MKNLSRVVCMLLLVALPLRALAVAWAGSCGAQDPAVAAAHECCDQEDAPAHGDADHRPTDHGSCGHCLACPAGAPALTGTVSSPAAIVPSHGPRIRFLARQLPSGNAQPLDRPPLSF